MGAVSRRRMIGWFLKETAEISAHCAASNIKQHCACANALKLSRTRAAPPSVRKAQLYYTADRAPSAVNFIITARADSAPSAVQKLLGYLYAMDMTSMFYEHVRVDAVTPPSDKITSRLRRAQESNSRCVWHASVCLRLTCDWLVYCIDLL